MRSTAIVITLVCLAGCVTKTRHGDARVEHGRQWLLDEPDVLMLPSIPLGKQASHRYKVRRLPQPAFPMELVIRSTTDEPRPFRSPPHPWQLAELHISFRSIEGDVLWEQTIRLADVQGRREFSSRFWTPLTWLHETWKLPPRPSYDVHISVLKPAAIDDYLVSLQRILGP
jgi:hypothetical protein